MIRLMAAARTALVVSAWLFGLPVVLFVVAGSPVPPRLPSSGQVQIWLQNPLDPVYKEQTAKILTWLVWGSITIAILLVVVLRMRTIRWGKVVGCLPPPAQSLAAAILGTAVVATSTSPLLTAPIAASAATSDLHDHEIPHTTRPSEQSRHPASVAVMSASGAPTAHRHIDPAAGTVTERATRGAAGAAADLPSRIRDAPFGVHRVVDDDNLWDIAARHLGDPHRWREIYKLNRGRTQADGHALTDPDEINIGWVLALPARHPGTEPAIPPVARHSRPAAHSSTPSVGASSTAAPLQQSTSGADSTGPSSPDPARSAASTHAYRVDQTPAASASVGMQVPGGWITCGLGAVLLTAAATVWRRRRHRYRPTPITSPRLNDPDLLPPLAAMTRIRTHLRRSAPETLDEQHPPMPTVREYQTATVKPTLPPIGPSGSDLAGAAELPLSTGLGLIGDGALDAARGLLVATLAAGSDDDPDAKGHAIIPAATLATLLGVSALDLGHLERLTVTSSQADAITALEEEIIRRSRLIADAHVADVRTLRDNDVHAEPMPQLLLIAERPDPAWTNRLVTTVRLGHSVDIGAVIVGDWPTGTTVTVAADGTTGIDSPRLSVLDTGTATEMLGLLREAHGDADPPAGPAPAETPATDRTEPDPVAEREPEEADHAAAPAAIPPAGPVPDGSHVPVAIRVLGRPAVLDAGGQPSPGIRSKAVELLVYLAVNRQGADLSDIMEALYPDANMRRASERLSTVVADLRKHIRRAAANPTDTTETLRQRLEPVPNTGSRYHLDPAVVSVDWWTVLDQYEAVATTTDTGRQLTHLTASLDAIGGALAEGVEYDWIDTDREVVRRHRIKLHVHTAALLADTDPHRSWLLLEQACEIDPLSDELARATIRAAATLGDADAIRHRLKTLCGALDAHGLDITDDTETLARDLLRELHPPRTSE